MTSAKRNLASVTTGLLSSLFLGTALLATPASARPEKPHGDSPLLTQFKAPAAPAQKADFTQRRYKTLTLENGLEVLLTCAPNVEASAAALSIGVGSLHDPAAKQGLAHYLEHMIFQGTQQYPEPGGFQKFVTANGGDANATTQANVTNYFYEVTHDAFDNSLDRFSSFFKNPLFSEAQAASEVTAVNNEFNNNIMNDAWRLNHLLNQFSEPGHPLLKFSTGSKATLAGDNRAALQEFFSKYYSARNMKLALISSMPLAQQEALVKKHFSTLPGFSVAKPVISADYRHPLNDAYRLLTMKTVTEEQTLILEFPTIRLADHLRSLPDNIVANVIGYEGKGSLLSQLKDEGLATTLSAGGSSPHPDLNSFRVNIGLTREGAQNHDAVLQRFFSYIAMLKTNGIERHSFEEIKKIARIDKKFETPDIGASYVSTQAKLMQGFSLDKVLTQPYEVEIFDADAYRRVLETLTPANMLVVLGTPTAQTDSIEPVYGTAYSFKHVSGPVFQKLLSPLPIAAMTYPEPNPFISENLTLTPQAAGEAATAGKPHLAVHNKLGKVWSLYDTQFNKPTTYLTVHMGTPHVSDTNENFIKAIMLQACVTEHMNDQAYPLQVAGMSYGINVNTDGITLNFGGYKDRLQDLIGLVARNITDCKLDEARFAVLKNDNLQFWNQTQTDSANIAMSALKRAAAHKDYNSKSNAAILERLTLADIKSYGQTIFRHAAITGLSHGNWNDRDVRQALSTLLQQTQSQPLPRRMPAVPHKVLLHPQEKALLSLASQSNNNALIYTIDAGPKDQKRWAIIGLIEQMTKADFYNEIRTRQQSGYTANSFVNKGSDRLSTGYLVQSADYGPVELQRRVEEWLKRVPGLIEQLSDTEFATFRRNHATMFRSKNGSIAANHNELFGLIYNEKADFSYHHKSAAIAEKLTRSEVLAVARALTTNNPTGRLIVHTRAEGLTEAVPNNAYRSVEEFRARPSHATVTRQPRGPLLTN